MLKFFLKKQGLKRKQGNQKWPETGREIDQKHINV